MLNWFPNLFLSLAMVGIVSPAPVKRVIRQRSLKVSKSVMIGEMLAINLSTSPIIRSVKRFVDLFVSNSESFRILKNIFFLKIDPLLFDRKLVNYDRLIIDFDLKEVYCPLHSRNSFWHNLSVFQMVRLPDYRPIQIRGICKPTFFDHSKSGHVQSSDQHCIRKPKSKLFERTNQNMIRMLPIFRCPVFRWLLCIK